MLDILRRNASSWIIKVLLGLICLVFIFFFGSSALRGPQQSTQSIAEIDGHPIATRQAQGLVRLIKDSDPIYQNLPPEYDQRLLQSAIQTLIENFLVEREALKLGVRIPDKQVSALIRANPEQERSYLGPTVMRDGSLWAKGQFDANLYKERFRPGYHNRYGFDYEAEVRGGLVRKPLRDLFADGVWLHDQEIAFERLLESTQLTVERVAFSADKILEKMISAMPPSTDNESQALPTFQDAQAEIARLTKAYWPKFLSGQLNKDTLADQGIELKTLEDISLKSATRLLDGQMDKAALAMVFSLSEDRTIPQAPITVGDTTYFFKLINKDAGTSAPANDNGTQLEFDEAKQKLTQEYADGFYQLWIQTLLDATTLENLFVPEGTS